MNLFFTRATEHLIPTMGGDFGAYTFKTFSDGELYVKIESAVSQQSIWVISSTVPPADNSFELYLLLDALQRAGAHTNLLLTYFGYARQDRAQKGEALSAQIMANILNLFDLKKIVVVHPHSQALHNFLEFQAFFPYDFFCSHAKSADLIVAPDKGAESLAQEIGKRVQRNVMVLEKVHPGPELSAIITIPGDVRGKSIIIVDDMITTAGTIAQASHALHKQGARSITVAATHGIFSHNAPDILEQSPIERVFVTNTIAQHLKHPKVTVVDLGPALFALLR